MKMKSSLRQRTKQLKRCLKDYHEGDGLFLSKSIGVLKRFFDKKLSDRRI